MKKGVRILLIVLMLLISGAAYLYFRIRAGVDSAVNVQKLEDGFYYMEYRDDYGFDRFLEQLPIWMWQSLSVRLCSKDFYIPVF